MADIAALLARGSGLQPVTGAVQGNRDRLRQLGLEAQTDLSQSQANLFKALTPGKITEQQQLARGRENQITAQEIDILNKMSEPQREQARKQVNDAAKIATQVKREGRSQTELMQALTFIEGFDTAGVAQALGQGMSFEVVLDSLIAESDEFDKLYPLSQPKEQKRTTLEQNLIAAGLTPGTPEYKKAVREATTKPLVSIDAADKKEAEETGKIHAQRFDRIIQKGEAARDALDNINQLEAIDVNTGALEPAKVAFASVIEGLGFNASGIANVSSAQMFQGVSNRMVNDVLNRAKGPQTEGDARRARSTLASLGNTPEANVFLNASLKALALRQIEQMEFIEQRMDQGESFSKSNKAWNEFKRKTPSLSAVVKTPDGIPVFFYQFKERAQQIRPGITNAEIIKAWRDKHGK